MRWLRRFLEWWQPAIEPDPWLAARIVPPTYRWRKADEALRKRTEAKRKAADGWRSRALNVDSGSAASDLLRRVK